MFTGLIEEIGSITAVTDKGDGVEVSVAANLVLSDVSLGDSIAVSGVCLTVTRFDSSGFDADVMKETVNHSAAGTWKAGTPVNLERAARAGDRLGGHIVQGHVDAIGEILDIRPGDQWRVVRVSLTPDIAPLVAHKGSITIDGISLTVSAVGRDWAEVSLIPETLSATTLGEAQVGDVVNIETDILARQVLRLKEFIVQELVS
jgi:riboflavin synthase